MIEFELLKLAEFDAHMKRRSFAVLLQILKKASETVNNNSK